MRHVKKVSLSRLTLGVGAGYGQVVIQLVVGGLPTKRYVAQRPVLSGQLAGEAVVERGPEAGLETDAAPPEIEKLVRSPP
jgi:hypothetical protein